MLFYVQMKPNLVGYISTVRRTSTNFVAMVGCQGSMVTMTTVSNNLPLYVSDGITSNFRELLPWNQTFSVKVLLKLVTMAAEKIPVTSFFYNIISLNLVHGFSVYS